MRVHGDHMCVNISVGQKSLHIHFTEKLLMHQNTLDPVGVFKG